MRSNALGRCAFLRPFNPDDTPSRGSAIPESPSEPPRCGEVAVGRVSPQGVTRRVAVGRVSPQGVTRRDAMVERGGHAGAKVFALAHPLTARGWRWLRCFFGQGLAGEFAPRPGWHTRPAPAARGDAPRSPACAAAPGGRLTALRRHRTQQASRGCSPCAQGKKPCGQGSAPWHPRLFALPARLWALPARLCERGARQAALGTRLWAGGARLFALRTRRRALAARPKALRAAPSALRPRLPALRARADGLRARPGAPLTLRPPPSPAARGGRRPGRSPAW